MHLEQCRLCGKDNGLSSVFDEKDLSMKIYMCFGVQIRERDGISKKICKSCYFFTNTVYEFRVNSIEHDSKLQEQYEKSQVKEVKKVETKNVEEEKVEVKKVEFEKVQTKKPEVKKVAVQAPVISYPNISQDAFLNTLNLANKNDSCLKIPVCHPSVKNLKRKFPNINLPENCLLLDVDPYVRMIKLAKSPKLDVDNLGVWSVKKSLGKQHELVVLTRIRQQSTDTNDSDSDVVSAKIRNGTQSSSSNSRKKRSSERYPVYGSKRKRVRSPRKPEEIRKPKPHSSIGTASTSNNQNIPKANEPDQTEKPNQVNDLPPPIVNGEDYDMGNLLVSRGEEIQTFICQTCNKVFDTLQLLNNHKKYAHKLSLRCSKCYKRFAIVESLVKHNVTCHPENTTKLAETKQIETKQIETKQTETKPNEVRNDQQPKSVARKKTNGTIEPSTANNPDITEYVISSDEDCEITNVIDNYDESNRSEPSSSGVQNGSPVLGSQNNSEQNDDTVITDALRPQISSLNNNGKKNITSKCNKDDILTIDDSDEETEVVNKNKSPFLGRQSSGEPDKIENSERATTPLSTSAQNTSTNNESISQNIVVVPSAEDKEHMDTSSSGEAKMTNEQSYINYIFNKCSFLANSHNQKKWFLKDVQRFTEKTYLPIELSNAPVENVVVEYKPGSKEKTADKTGFWSVPDTIHHPPKEASLLRTSLIGSNSTPLQNVLPVSCQTPTTIIAPVSSGTQNVRTYSKANQTKVVKVNPNISSTETVSHRPVTVTNSSRTTPYQPKTTSNVVLASKTTVSYANRTVASTSVQSNVGTILRGPNISGTNVKTIQSQPKATSNVVPSSKTPILYANRTEVSANVQSNFGTTGTGANTSDTNNVKTVQTQPKSIANVLTVRNPITYTNRAASVQSNVDTTDTGANIQSNSEQTIRVLPTNFDPLSGRQINTVKSLNQGGRKYIMQNDKIYLVQNSSEIDNTNIVLPTVSAPITEHESHPNFDQAASSHLVNLALKNASTNYTQQTNQVKSSKLNQLTVSLYNKPVLPVSPTRGPMTVTSSAESGKGNQIPNGYILMGIKDGVLQPTKESLILRDNISPQQISLAKPLVLNGMPYNTMAKLRTQEQPTYILQPNINIQNSINICQQDITNHSNENYTVTFPSGMVRTQNSGANALEAVTSSNQTQMVSSNQLTIASPTTESVDNTTVSTPRPMIRIRNISELRGENLTPNQRNELHSLYTSALTQYVQNHSSIMNPEANDEYLQIT